MPINLISSTYRITGSRSLRDEGTDANAVDHLKEGVTNGFGKSSLGEQTALLSSAIKTFEKNFCKSSLWEHFKDFFGLSDEIDNQRDVATLFALKVFSDAMPLASDDDRFLFAHLLQETGIAPRLRDSSPKELVAKVIVRLLDSNPGLAAHESFKLCNATIARIPATFEPCLLGELRLGDALPSFFKDFTLPFFVTTKSAKYERYEGYSVDTFTRLYQILPIEEQLIASVSEDTLVRTLFTREGRLEHIGLGQLKNAETERDASKVVRELESKVKAGAPNPFCISLSGADGVSDKKTSETLAVDYGLINLGTGDFTQAGLALIVRQVYYLAHNSVTEREGHETALALSLHTYLCHCDARLKQLAPWLKLY